MRLINADELIMMIHNAAESHNITEDLVVDIIKNAPTLKENEAAMAAQQARREIERLYTQYDTLKDTLQFILGRLMERVNREV